MPRFAGLGESAPDSWKRLALTPGTRIAAVTVSDTTGGTADWFGVFSSETIPLG